MYKKSVKFIVRHKIATGIIILIIAGGGYYGYKYLFGASVAARYVSAQVQKGTLIVSITGSGQVSASNQVDIKPRVSGEITALYAKLGQEMSTGAVLAAIDAADAQRTARDAETSLETAKLELDKLLEPLDELTLLQAENSLMQTKESKQKAEDNLKKAYEDGFNTVANAFLNLPSVMAGLHDMLYSSDTGLGGGSQWNIDFYANAVRTYDEKVLQYKADAADKYLAARSVYNKNFDDYKQASRFSERNAIESLINETYDTTKAVAEAVKSANNLIQFYQDKLIEHSLKPQTLSNTHLSSLTSYTGTTNSYLSSLLSAERSIQDYKESIVNAERSIGEKELSLAKIKKGPDDLDIRAKKVAIQQREDALATAKQTLADHYVRAPFAGVIAKVSAKKGDSASASTIIATLITKQRIAEISLNEVDVSKVKVNQKVTITFDAIEGLSITGEVAEIDSVGAVTQGVVTYGVKIGFDTQLARRSLDEGGDDRVKPGMSVSAAIITDAKQNVLLVPSSAVKQQNDAAYVEIFTGETQTPRQQIVQVGLSNDTMTEIVSGLNEGGQVVTQTITASASQSQTQQNTGLRIPGITGGGGGGGMRR